MKAIVQRDFGPAEVLRHEEVADPVPAPADIVLRVAYTGVNRLDLLQRTGPALLPGFSLPHIAGMDISGTVVGVGVGAGARGLAVGDRVVVNPSVACGTCTPCRSGDDAMCAGKTVLGGNAPGGYAEYCAVPAGNVLRLPDALSLEAAAAVASTWPLMWYALAERAALQPGERLLVRGASGGLSVAALQIAKHLGATVLVTGRSEEKLELARAMGADVVIHEGEADVVKACREHTGGFGVDAVLDHVGAATFTTSLRSLRPRGRLLFCGSTTGSAATLDLPYAYHFGLSLIGVSSYRSEDFGRAIEFFHSSGCSAVIGGRYPLAEAGVAHRRMEGGAFVGKLMLCP